MSEQHESLDTEELRCRVAELEEAGWSDIVDAQNAAVPAFYAAADEIDALRSQHPHSPTREQIAELLWDENGVPWRGNYKMATPEAKEQYEKKADAVLALFHNGADRV